MRGLNGWARKVKISTRPRCVTSGLKPEWIARYFEPPSPSVYADVVEDGDIGRNTITALRAYYAKRGFVGEKVILKAANCLQGAFYIDISRTRKANEDFTFGWFANRID